jgi:hypothetical protein
MADERADEMTPSAIERDIARALAVDPSPEFVARVRMRIASEPPPHRAWWMPVLVGATAIAAAVTIAVVAPWRGSQVPLEKAPDTQVRLKPDPTEGVGSGFSRTRSATSTAVASAFRRTKASQAAEPEVLVPQAEIDMYRRLIARAIALEPAAVVEPPREFAADLEPPSELIIDPIKIEPITPPSGEGERR